MLIASIFTIWLAMLLTSMRLAYFLITPYSAVFYAILLTYGLPSITHPSPNNFKIFIHLNLFFCLFSFLILFLPKPRYSASFPYVRPSAGVYSLALLFWFVSLLSGLDSWTLVFDRMVNPRDYTHIRAGTGAITFVSIFLTFIATFYAAQSFWKLRDKNSLLWLILFGCINILGGGKASVIALFFILLFAYFSINGIPSIKVLIVSGLASFVLLLLSFGIFARSGARTLDLSSLVLRLTKYQTELKYTAELSREIDLVRGAFFEFGIVQTLLTPIPRAIFPEKHSGGIYEEFLNKAAGVSSDPAHFETPGMVMEGLLLFGDIWWVVYAFLAYAFCALPILLRARINAGFLWCCWLFLMMFGLVRAGFFFTTFWMLFLGLFAIWVVEAVHRRRVNGT